MKALILKDLCQLKAYCKSLLLMVGVFTLVIPFSDGNLFFCIYPVMMISMLPMTLLSYDERTKWNCYCAALPFRRSQIVTAKYLLCLLLTLPMALLVLGLSAIRIAVSGSGQWSALAVLAVSLLVMSTLSSSLSMPFLFRFGVEKGRLLYIIIVCIACGSISLSCFRLIYHQHKLRQEAPCPLRTQEKLHHLLRYGSSCRRNRAG